ncbi:MAG: DUF3786 domain-containing protein [Chloroflexota bacterium]
MEKRFSLPGEKGYDKAYELAYKLACDRLAKIDDIKDQCRRSGARYHETASKKKEIIIEYINQPYRISLPESEVSLVDSSEPVPIRDKILILHYLISAKGTPLANELINFRELEEGSVYAPTFAKRTIEPLLNNFGKNSELLLEVGAKLGGHKADYGDTSITIKAFPFVPVTIVLWRGDEEFAPQGNVLFDVTVSDYLPTEDITVLCETITWRLIRYLKSQQ